MRPSTLVMAERGLRVVLVTLTLTCVAEAEPNPPGAATDVARPLHFGVVGDLTGSAVGFGTPAVNPPALEPLIVEVVGRGGTLAVTSVRTNAVTELLRLTVTPPEPAPTRPDLSHVPLFRQATVLREFLRRHDAWKRAEAARVGTAQTRVAAFREQLEDALSVERRDRHSDVAGALRRMDRYLREPAPSAVTCLLVVSDLVHTAAGGPATYNMAAAATTAWVYGANAETQRARLPKSTTPFEGLDAAVTWLRGECR